jgi:BirA family biotin operon repressor/biotin-[acetyl-CoA-carboxylase] ligase
VVVGIGINFSTRDFPDELRQSAGAVFDDPPAVRNRLAAEVINRILYPKNERDLMDDYKKRLMMIGKNVLVSGAEEPYEALAVDVDELGRLVVKKDTGEMLSLSAGEISIRFK